MEIDQRLIFEEVPTRAVDLLQPSGSPSVPALSVLDQEEYSEAASNQFGSILVSILDMVLRR
jgi:hypothetical protein